RCCWHRAQSADGRDDRVADELEVSHAAGPAVAAIWALERSAQLTSDGGKRGRRLLLAAEHAFELGRADVVGRLLSAAVRCPLSGPDLARAQWLRGIFSNGVPGDAAQVTQLCSMAERVDRAGDRDLALN